MNYQCPYILVDGSSKAEKQNKHKIRERMKTWFVHNLCFSSSSWVPFPLAMRTVCLFVCLFDGMENKQAERVLGWVETEKRLVFWSFCFISAKSQAASLGPCHAFTPPAHHSCQLSIAMKARSSCCSWGFPTTGCHHSDLYGSIPPYFILKL